MTLSIARQQVEDRAQIIDVNMDDGLLDAQAEMTTPQSDCFQAEVARVPVMIDSSKWDVIVAGLKCLQGKSIVNSISERGRGKVSGTCPYNQAIYSAATASNSF